MNASDRAGFAELLKDAMVFYRRDLSKFAMSVWWEACKSFDLEQVSKAITAHAMDPEQGRFPPMPADIVKQLQGTRTDRSLIAWGKTLEAISGVGGWSSVAFDDPVIHATVEDLGGWSHVCAVKMDELPFLQKRFTDSYRAYATRPDIPYLAVLRGATDANNAKFGKLSKPVLIGDPKKAAAVAAGPSTERAQITHVADSLLRIKEESAA